MAVLAAYGQSHSKVAKPRDSYFDSSNMRHPRCFLYNSKVEHNYVLFLILQEFTTPVILETNIVVFYCRC